MAVKKRMIIETSAHFIIPYICSPFPRDRRRKIKRKFILDFTPMGKEGEGGAGTRYFKRVNYRGAIRRSGK